MEHHTPHMSSQQHPEYKHSLYGISMGRGDAQFDEKVHPKSGSRTMSQATSSQRFGIALLPSR